MIFRWNVPIENLPFLLEGALLTLKLVGVASVFGIILGIIASACRTSKNKFIYGVSTAYVEIFRNTPLLVQVFYAYFALPTLNIDLSPSQSALIVLSLNAGAYMCEIIRAGVESIHKSQIESGYSLGLNSLQIFRHIILPPAMKAIALPLGSQIIALTLGSCVVSQVGAEELLFRAMVLENRTFRSFEIYIVTIIIYFIMAEILYLLINYANKKFFGITQKQRMPPII